MTIETPGDYACAQCQKPIQVVVQNPRAAALSQRQAAPVSNVRIDTDSIGRGFIFGSLIIAIVMPLVWSFVFGLQMNTFLDRQQADMKKAAEAIQSRIKSPSYE
jgi:hypothetical protein